MEEKKEQQYQLGAFGFCRYCGQEHRLSAAPAQEAALELMSRLETAGRIDDIDGMVPLEQADPRCSLDYLQGPARGKMFGVLLARTSNSRHIQLKAFSGQYNGLWQVPGWVDPVFDLHTFHQVHDTEERAIKALSRKINRLSANAQERQELIQLRKKKSQQLMREIHSLYRLHNFQGRAAELEKIFGSNKGMPTGTGDCCAPKLLHHAALHGLTPLGLAEFYLGRENASGTRQHGCFYPSCRRKCYPILGFMLCGAGQSEKEGEEENL